MHVASSKPFLTRIPIFGIVVAKQVQKSLPIAVWSLGRLTRLKRVINAVAEPMSRVIVTALEHILGVTRVALDRRKTLDHLLCPPLKKNLSLPAYIRSLMLRHPFTRALFVRVRWRPTASKLSLGASA